MREPTKEEMIEGISREFKQFLESADPFGPLRRVGIASAISEGVRLAHKEKLDKGDYN